MNKKRLTTKIMIEYEGEFPHQSWSELTSAHEAIVKSLHGLPVQVIAISVGTSTLEPIRD